MKKLNALLVTMITAIFAFSFSAFAEESVMADTYLQIKRDGSGTNSITYFFNKNVYEFNHKCPGDDKTDGEQLVDSFNNSPLKEFLNFKIDDTSSDKYTKVIFSHSFKDMGEYNNICSDLVLNSVAQDISAYSTIYDQDDKRILSISQWSFNAISYATSYFLFLENPIAENDCKYTYSLNLSDSLGVYTDLPIKNMNYDERLEYDLNSADAKEQDKIATTAKPSATSKPSAKPVVKTNVKKDKTPKTGDNSKLVVLISLMAVSLLLSVVFIKKLNKNRVK